MPNCALIRRLQLRLSDGAGSHALLRALDDSAGKIDPDAVLEAVDDLLDYYEDVEDEAGQSHSQ